LEKELTIELRRQASNIHGGSSRQVLESSFYQAHIPALTQPPGSPPLGERCCNPYLFVVGRFPGQGRLLVPDGLESFVFVME
jgi:hypothetical protein